MAFALVLVHVDENRVEEVPSTTRSAGARRQYMPSSAAASGRHRWTASSSSLTGTASPSHQAILLQLGHPSERAGPARPVPLLSAPQPGAYGRAGRSSFRSASSSSPRLRPHRPRPVGVVALISGPRPPWSSVERPSAGHRLTRYPASPSSTGSIIALVTAALSRPAPVQARAPSLGYSRRVRPGMRGIPVAGIVSPGGSRANTSSCGG